MNVRVGPYRKLNTEQLMLLNSGAGEELWCSPLDCKEIQPVNPKGNQSWIFIGKTDAENETPIIWPPDAKNWLIGKDPNPGQDGKQENWTTGDEVAGWHHQLNGHEFEQVLGVVDGHRSLASCNPCCHKELYMTEWLNWTETQPLWIKYIFKIFSKWKRAIMIDNRSRNYELGV